MIALQRPKEAPAVLRQRGARKRRTHCTAFTKHAADYQSGKKLFVFDGAIYSHDTVKDTLRELQRGKCAFCESRFDHISYGDVEHLRPKAAVQQDEDSPMERPGYYWLAYEWTNLLLSCTLCNQAFKRNLYPLRDPARRARSHKAKLTDEEPLFVDPASAAAPEAHLSFRAEVPFPLDDRGEATIRVVRLDRRELNQRRREHLAKLKVLHMVARHPDIEPALREQARVILDEAIADGAEYAAATRAAISAWDAGVDTP